MIISAPKMNLSVVYKTEILEDGCVVSARPPKRNLILDSGLNLVGTLSTYGSTRTDWNYLTSYCAVGSGTTPTKRDSGAITFTRTGARVTASDAFFQSADVGRLLKFDSGEEMYMQTYVSPTQADMRTSGNLPASEGTLWYVEQTGLTTEKRRQQFNSSLDNTVVYDAPTGTVRFRGTYLFPVETANVVYTEIGWSYSASAGQNLFGRDLVPGGGDALTPNQQYRVTVDLYVSYAPLTPQTFSVPIDGLPDFTGKMQIEDLYMFAPMNMGYNQSGAWYGNMVLSADTTALRTAGYNTASTVSSLNFTNLSRIGYAAGTYNLTFQSTWTGSSSASSYNNIRSIAFNTIFSNSTRSMFRLLLDAPFSRNGYYTLILKFSVSWGRVLVN